MLDAPNELAVRSEAPPLFIDVHLKSVDLAAFLRAIAFAVCVAFAGIVTLAWPAYVVASAAGGDSPLAHVAALVPFGLLIGLGLYDLRKREARWIRPIVRSIRARTGSEMIARIARERRIGVFEHSAEWFCKELAKGGAHGCCIRIDTFAQPQQVEPFPFAFEPRILKEGTGDFRELTSANGDSEFSSEFDGSLRAMRVLRRPGVFTSGFFLILGLGLLASGQNALATGGVGSLFAALIVGAAAYSALAERVRWMIVPSGVVLLDRRGFLPIRRIRILPRDETVVLATRRDEQSSWRVSIATRAISATRRMSDAELSLFLRAWSSPIAMPDRAKIQQWISGELAAPGAECGATASIPRLG